MTDGTRLWSHQQKMVEWMRSVAATPPHGGYNASDPGTGKTLAVLEWVARQPHTTLILAPKTLLDSAWMADLRRFHPELAARTLVVTAPTRHRLLDPLPDPLPRLVITNLEAVNWLAPPRTQPHPLTSHLGALVVDEATAFKNASSQRSRAAERLVALMRGRAPTAPVFLMSGTPWTITLEELWHQYRLIDGGGRLGRTVSRFRASFRTPVRSFFGVSWEDRPQARDQVQELISDITIRYSLDECLSIPGNHVTWRSHPLPASAARAFKQLRKEAVVVLHNRSEITAVNAAALRVKLLQLASGAVYDSTSTAQAVHPARYELIADLIEQRPWPCLVFFLWRHQRDLLARTLRDRSLPHQTIDGDTPPERRAAIVEEFQSRRSKTRVLLLHPATAAHGLTLTRARSVIFAAPPGDRPDWWTQCIARVRRGGQRHRTETIVVHAADPPGLASLEKQVYQALIDKVDGTRAFLKALEEWR